MPWVTGAAPVTEAARVTEAAPRATDGNTIRSIAVVRRIGTGQPQTNLGAPPVVILLLTDKPVPGNNWVDRAVICLATGREAPA
jgi:hypothetical protein